MKKVLSFILAMTIAVSAFSIGLRPRDYVIDYNKKYDVTWHNCGRVAMDFYDVFYMNLQLANLQWMSISTGVVDPITNIDGHAILTWTEGRTRYVITTATDDNIHFYAKLESYGSKSLSDVARSFRSKYIKVKMYRKGFGYTEKTREQPESEEGKVSSQLDDAWGRIGKHKSYK